LGGLGRDDTGYGGGAGLKYRADLAERERAGREYRRHTLKIELVFNIEFEGIRKKKNKTLIIKK